MNSESPSRRAGGGFTLIELLVVVAIIAVLVSILLPSLNGARKQARQVLCNTRLREQGKAAQIYAHDHRDTIIRAEADRGEWGFNLHFASILLPGLGHDGRIDVWREGTNQNQKPFHDLLEQTKPLQCPSFPDPEQVLDFVVSSFPIPYTAGSAQRDGNGGQQGDGARGQPDVDAVVFFRLTAFPAGVSPAEKIYITEAHPALPNNGFNLYDLFYASQLPFGSYPRISNDARHPGGVNALYFDGHAETMPFRKLDPGWPAPLSQRLRWFTVVPPEIDTP